MNAIYDPVNWPGAAGICCQCFEPVSSQELYQARPGGRKFHKRCYDQGGYYVKVEEKAAATRTREGTRP